MELHPDDKQLLLHQKDFPEDVWAEIERFREYVVKRVKEGGWTKGAELGVRRGQLLFRLLDACPELHMIAVDAWEPNKADMRSVHTDYERRVRVRAKQYKGRITIIKAYTNQAVKNVKDRSLDFVFIDADHSYNNCKEDIELWSAKIKKDGYLLGDDYHRTPGVKRAVTELLPKHEVLSPNIWISPNTL